jgi:hypothetical protein
VAGVGLTVTCSAPLTAQFQHTGTSLTGRLTYGRWACSPPEGTDFVPSGTSVDFSGTASGGQITVAVPSAPGCGTAQFAGSYTNTTIDFTGSFQCTIEGFRVTGMEVIKLTKQQ